ncbi:conserved hypothetical protein [Culex quinquefasciatus]|uniref:LIM zinc-binding domain-containing protein n=1 Tax=Culex quinquefasciatus TaxID=7176 RepID=B0WW83_CULQU|nr:conserved hypothetical protein [Culex quinquefasciatus]|eukprot:XP_001861655.1 conserved hypothetical protein [Culex quinquefasciatus]
MAFMKSDHKTSTTTTATTPPEAAQEERTLALAFVTQKPRRNTRFKILTENTKAPPRAVALASYLGDGFSAVGTRAPPAKDLMAFGSVLQHNQHNIGRGEPPSGVVDPCAGCNKPILDKFLLNVLERGWHASCVRCCECHQPLSDKCFSRESKLYCRNDFFRKQLSTGEQLYVLDDNKFICKDDYLLGKGPHPSTMTAHKEATARSFLPFNCTINVPPAILPTETGALTIRPSRPRTRDAWEEGFFCALAVSRKKSTRTLSYYSFSGKTLNGTPQSSMPGQQGAE